MLGAAADAAAQYTDLAAAMCAFQILDPLSLRYLDRFVVKDWKIRCQST